MKHFVLGISLLVVLISIIITTLKSETFQSTLQAVITNTSKLASIIKLANIGSYSATPLSTTTTIATLAATSEVTTNTAQATSSMLNAVKNTMSKTLHAAKITPHRSSSRGHGNHGWLDSYHSFSFADWYDPRYTSFGALRVLNEDRVKPNSGFPTHPHRDYEIFSYILSGELTHRDSMLRKGAEGGQSDRFYRMRRGDVQFTTGGTGIAHSEMNENNKDTVHFLQIWARPHKTGLTPRYHTQHFDDDAKRLAFVPLISPLKAGPEATAAEDKEAEPALEGTIPIHADLVMGAGLIAPGKAFEWKVGADAVRSQSKRRVYVHVPMTKGGKAMVKLDGRDDAVLNEGDGAFVEAVNAGDKLSFESVGEAEAEVIVLDSN